MLDVITDFWKPARKTQPLESKFDFDGMQVGSVVAFGFTPQSILSGKRFIVSAINTYDFGEDRHTSFVLREDQAETIALFILESGDGTKFMAISRRIPEADRNSMFNRQELNDVLANQDVTSLKSTQVDPAWKQWVVENYSKKIHRMNAKITSGDYRGIATMPTGVSTAPFEYAMLESDSQEYALEAERYAGGRLELYATIYRRTTDLAEIINPGKQSQQDEEKPMLEKTTPVKSEVETKARQIQDEEDSKPVKPLFSMSEPSTPETSTSKPSTENTMFNPTTSPAAPKPESMNGMATPAQADAANTTSKAATSATTNTTYPIKEVKAVSTRNGAEMENEAIECDLRVANKIIEEAIRNELRLSDVVRRIIALPVAYPEAVQIPITLSDSDFQLLAIRYGINASERNAIKTKIMEEISDFSGGKKAAAQA